jgi:hypothetical protein
MKKPSILVEQRLRNNKFSLKENKHVNNKNFGIRSKPEDNKKSKNKKSRKPEDSRKPETKKRSCENKLEGNRKPLSKLKNQKM